MRTLMLAASAALVLSLFSCSDRSASRFDVPSTPILGRTLGFAVVYSAYAQVYDAPGNGGVVLGYYRRGVVLPLSERRLEHLKNESVVWVKNEGGEPGWMRQSDLQVYDSEAQAKTAVAGLNP